MKFFIISIFILIIGTFSILAQSTRQTEIENSSDFQPIQVNQQFAECREVLLANCGRQVLLALDMVGLGGEDNFREREEIFSLGNGKHAFVFSILAKDRTFTHEWRVRIGFAKTRRGFQFEEAGIQHRCLIGQNRGNWQKNECGSQSQDNRRRYDNNRQLLNRKTLQREVQNIDDFMFLSITGRAAGVLATPCRGTLESCGSTKFNALYKPMDFDGIPARNIKRETFTYQSGRITKGVFLITYTGYEDDSVAGERIRIEFNKRGNSWIAQNGSKQFLCQRGGFANRWTKEFCP